MNTIVFIETTKSGSSREAIQAAEQLGYFTALITERKQFIKQRREFPDVHQMHYIKKITDSEIRDHISNLQKQGNIIKAIVGFVDPFVSLAASLTNELCGSDISVEALKIMEDKIVTRKMLKENTTNTTFISFDPTEELESFVNNIHQFPLIVKSPFSKASKDVYLIHNKSDLEKSMKKTLNLYPYKNILLEEYLDGPQYLVEVLVHNNEIHIVAIIKQEITKRIKFIVTGYEIQLNMEQNFHESLYAAIKSIITDLEITNAACHFEMRYVNGVWKLIEINPRISGGAMNRMIEEAFGINLMKKTLQLYLGHKPSLKRQHEAPIYTHYITIGSYGTLLKVTGRNRATKHPGVRDVYIKPRKGTPMSPPLSMGHRYGYVMASGDTVDEAKSNAVNAARLIKFYLEPS